MRRFAFGLAFATATAIAPIWAKADDRQIAQTIVTKLKEQKASGELRGFDIDLSVKDGEVLLKGYVADKDQQTLAIDAARYVSGVKKVINDLQIREEPAPAEAKQVGYTRVTKDKNRAAATREEANEAYEREDDKSSAKVAPAASAKPVQIESEDGEADEDQDEANAELANRVLATLKKMKDSGQLKQFGIDLSVENGEVRLSGSVASVEQKNQVINAVRKISGVSKVLNELAIVEVDSAIPAELPHDPIEAAPAVSYSSSYSARTSAQSNGEADAMAIVQEVVDRLQQKRDEGILHGFELDVRCDNGSVLLTGTVPSVDQQVAVLDVVRRVPGVKQVVNNLAVAGLQIPAAYVAGPAGPIQVAPAQLTTTVPQNGPLVHTGSRPAQTPMAYAPARIAGHHGMMASQAPIQATPTSGSPVPMQTAGYGIAPARYDHPNMPGYAWPSYASYPNYAAVTYPKQYSATAWPYIGPFYPYPQVPLGWRKVSLEWDDGWWMLDFKDR